MNPGLNLRLHHLGLAVRRFKDAEAFLCKAGYVPGEEVIDPLQNARLKLCLHQKDLSVELIAPHGVDSPVESILKDLPALAYHCCFEVRNIEAAVAHLTQGGLRVLPISAPKPAVLFSGRRVSFHQSPGFGVFELLEGAL